MLRCRWPSGVATDKLVKMRGDAIRRGAGQIIPTCRRVCYAAFLLAKPALQEPVFSGNTRLSVGHVIMTLMFFGLSQWRSVALKSALKLLSVCFSDVADMSTTKLPPLYPESCIYKHICLLPIVLALKWSF